jgi:uncharacterized membrane protein HdeD (DUF308 family)
VSTSVGDRRRVVGGILLAAAGAYILFQPFHDSPGSCVGTLSRFAGVAEATRMCVAATAPTFVPGLVTGLLTIVAALWILLPAETRVGTLLLAAAVVGIISAGAVAFATSPTGPFRTFQPAQTAIPVQTSAPTRGP